MKKLREPQGIDYQPRSIQNRNANVAKTLARLGATDIVQNRSHREKLPPAVCQKVVTDERQLFSETVGRRLRNGLEKGWLIYFVTTIDGAFSVEPKNLKAAHFLAVKQRVQRRARGLAVQQKCFVGGVVDISLNDETKTGGGRIWQPHAHFFVRFPTRNEGQHKKLLRNAFKPGRGSNGNAAYRPVEVKRIETEADLNRVIEYVTSKLLAECQQRRIGYIDKTTGRKNARDWDLRRSEMNELISVLLSMHPKQRWILSGLRRDGVSVRRLQPKYSPKAQFKICKR